MKNLKITPLFYMIIIAVFFFSCKDDEKEQQKTPYDPGKPVQITGFDPQEGGLATKMIISGSNFGIDKNKVNVYFNHKKASIVDTNGEKIYVMTPRLPGDTCLISVVIENDSVTATQEFYYHTSVTVTTIAGKPGTTDFTPGTLAEATFINPSFLCVDPEDNIFMSNWAEGAGNYVKYNFVLINQKNNQVIQLFSGQPTNVPTVDTTGNIVMVPQDSYENYYEFDAKAQWAVKTRSILHPSADEQAEGMIDFGLRYKHAFATNYKDGYIYTRGNKNNGNKGNGDIVRFHPVTRKGQKVGNVLPDNDTYMIFHPDNYDILYLIVPQSHCIYTYNIGTQELELFAGRHGTSGNRTGYRTDALFNQPRQAVFDEERNMLVADEQNHCIRKISPEGYVTTLIGQPGKSGYQDGNAEDALFNRPRGVAIDKDYNVYIGDFKNGCVRKLATE